MVDGSVINMHRKDKGDMEQSDDIHKKLTVTRGGDKRSSEVWYLSQRI